MLGRLADDTGGLEGLDGGQAAVLALCHPREGEERCRFTGSPARRELGGRGRVEKSFSCESRDDSCHHGGEKRWGTGSKPSRKQWQLSQNKQSET